MTIQQCKYVLKIAKTGSFNEAAKQLFVAQSSLSLSIKSLKQELNIKNFERFGNGVVIAYKNRQHFESLREKIERINNVFDAVGLAAFSITGTEIACASGHSDNMLLVVIMGMITGVGGGMFRDVLVARAPYVLKKHIYALASLVGSILYYVIREGTQNILVGTVVSMLVVVFIRMLATKYRWKLPRM